MNLNYDINSNFSLTSLCTVAVVRQVLEASGNAPGGEKPYFIVEKDVMDILGRLNLPHLIKEIIKTLVRPVYDDLNFWQKKLKLFEIFHPPVLTKHGTVDLTSSTEAILKDRMTRLLLQRKMDDMFCFPIRGEEIRPPLTVNELFRLAISGDREMPSQFLIEDILEEDISEVNPFEINAQAAPLWTDLVAFRTAMYSCNETELKIIMDRTSPQVIERILRNEFGISFMRTRQNNLSPSFYCLIFSKMGRLQQRDQIAQYAFLVLSALLKWPYQQFFLEASKLLITHIETSSYWKIMTKIARKAAVGYKDCDYLELLVKFWDLGAAHKRDSSMRNYGGFKFVFYILMTKDEHSIDCVLGEASTELKNSLLLDVTKNTICSTLIRQKEFELLEKFLRVCAMNRRDLLAQFKEIFEQKCHMGPLTSWTQEFNNQRWSQEEWKDGMRRFDSIVDKLIAETYCS